MVRRHDAISSSSESDSKPFTARRVEPVAPALAASSSRADAHSADSKLATPASGSSSSSRAASSFFVQSPRKDQALKVSSPEKPSLPSQDRILLPHHSLFKTRWSLICDVLSRKLEDAASFAEALQTLSPANSSVASAEDSLIEFFEDMSSHDRETFFADTLPFIQSLVLELPVVFPLPDATLPCLKAGEEHTLDLSRHQVACLLAASFFVLHPSQPHRKGLSTAGKNSKLES